MKRINTPDSFRPQVWEHIGHGDSRYSVAEAFYAYANRNEIDTDLIYLPVFWTNGYFAQSVSSGMNGFQFVPEVQKFIDSKLDPNERYFTVSRADEGTYETLPDNVVLFNSCGRGDVDIPLVSGTPRRHRGGNRKHLASFMGTKEIGGPVDPKDNHGRSSWNHDGEGALTRRAMFDAFGGEPDVLLLDGNKGWEAYERELSCSHFALCPRGYALASFRLFESMACGCVPVYISDEFCLPYKERIDWDTFCVICNRSDLPGLPRRLRQLVDTPWFANAVETIDSLYDDFFSLDGVCRQIHRYLEEGIPT